MTRCVERGTGRPVEEHTYAPALLAWCYNTTPGRLLMARVLARPWVSRLYGWWMRRPCAPEALRRFCDRLAIDLSDSLRPLTDFRSIDDLVTRRIDLATRPADRDPATCVAPADGRYLVYSGIAADTPFRIKHFDFDLRTFLRDDALAAAYGGGDMAVARLTLADYHHFHFPLAGRAGLPRRIAGRYHATSPYASTGSVPVFAQNARIVTLLDTARFGRVAMVEVGAFTIGSIREDFVPGPVARGAHKGFFAFGASIVVVLFPRGRIRFDADLLTNTARGSETWLRLGESLGRPAAD